MDYTHKMKRCHEYVEALEEEHKKILVFQRELPLCLELVTQAIESCRKELSGSSSMSEHVRSQSECSERTTSECGGVAAVFEEFIPIKWSSSSSSDHENDRDGADEKKIKTNNENNGDKKKSDWLRSVQLWNQSPDPQPKEDDQVVNKQKAAAVIGVKRNNAGAFQPFQKEKPNKANDHSPQPLKTITPTPTTTSSSTAETVGGKSEFEQLKQSQSSRKQRRCWSPELHRRFLHALQQLGGSHVATPKQIRDLMKVDGLTNDEVKSHLQKYRLHTRRPATPSSTNGGENQQQQQRQFMVVEGIWVPSSHDHATNTRVYAPVATQPPPQSSQSGERSSSHRCKSPATSSSTHTPQLLPLS
ncbi:PREDICTED: myb family transcription factor EFM-like [Camelina sativa]|uniref:Myb family transcription factor EFM-like n=1 Tax=Camelina sativa TaxID=90675 RepID=A0ABM0VS68_CAMSA|nr:PREDICTED: myb family transcription factor EFM-like [Camelina sativa]